MIIAGNSHVALFRNRLKDSSTGKLVKVKWVGALTATHFVQNSSAARAIRKAFENYGDWKILSIGMHDIFGLCLAQAKNTYQRALVQLLDQYKSIFDEFNRSGKFGWLVSPQQLDGAQVYGLSETTVFDITNQFNREISQWCQHRGIIVINPLSQILDDNHKPKTDLVQMDGIHLNEQSLSIYSDLLTHQTSTDIICEPICGASAHRIQVRTETQSLALLVADELGLDWDRSGMPAGERAVFEKKVLDHIAGLLKSKGVSGNLDRQMHYNVNRVLNTTDLVDIYKYASDLFGNAINFDVNIRQLDTVAKISRFFMDKKTLSKNDFFETLSGDTYDNIRRSETLSADNRIQSIDSVKYQNLKEIIHHQTGGETCQYGVIYFWCALIEIGKGNFSFAHTLLNNARSNDLGIPFLSSRIKHYIDHCNEMRKSDRKAQVVSKNKKNAACLLEASSKSNLLECRYGISDVNLMSTWCDQNSELCKKIESLYVMTHKDDCQAYFNLFPNLKRLDLFVPVNTTFHQLSKTYQDNPRIKLWPFILSDRSGYGLIGFVKGSKTGPIYYQCMDSEIHNASVLSTETVATETFVRKSVKGAPDMLICAIRGVASCVANSLSTETQYDIKAICLVRRNLPRYLRVDQNTTDNNSESDPYVLFGSAPVSRWGERYSHALYVNPRHADSFAKRNEKLQSLLTNNSVPSGKSPLKAKVTARLKKIDPIDIDQSIGVVAQSEYDDIDCMVTFILPTKDRAEGLNKTLGGLSDAMKDIPYEIILYADQRGKSIDEYQKAFNIQKTFYDGDLFSEGEVFSWSKLMNHGFSKASGQWIIYGSDDIVLYPSSIKNAISTALNCSSEKIGGVSFLHRNIDETYGGFFKEFGYDTLNGDKLFINFGMIHANAYARTNGFDENLRFFWADVDLCTQIHNNGYHIIPSFGSFVDHHNVLEKDQKKDRVALFERDTDYFFNKWHNAKLFGDRSPVDKVRYCMSDNEAQEIIDRVAVHQNKATGADAYRKTTVAIDGVIFQLQAGRTQGISRVWRALISELVRHWPNLDIIVLQRDRFPIPIDGVRIHRVAQYHFEDCHNPKYEDDEILGRACRELKADLFVTTYFTRASGMTNLVMIHDLIPEKFNYDLSQPEWAAKQRIIDTADAFICVSQTTQKDLVAEYPQIAKRPIVVAQNGLDDCFCLPSDNEVARIREKLKLTSPYVMLVGNRHGYKNGDRCLSALAKIECDNKPTVLCVGGEHTLSPIENRLKEKLNILYAGQLTDQDLIAAYGGALALMVPSQYEGFGLTVIEAMACGCPVIANVSPAVVEIGGDTACIIENCDSEIITKALSRVRSPDHRQAMIRKGYDRAAAYNWQKTARKVGRFMTKLMDQPSILLTAIVSTYNAEEYIRGCLDDLMHQTISDRMEIIVVDSASKQDEAAAVRDFQRRHPNIKYIRTPYRETVYQAWNRGIKFARGKYISNANTDDRHRQDAFELMVRVLEENENCALVYADVIKTRTANETFNQCTPTGMYRWHDWDRRTLLSRGCFIGPQPVWRKKVHETYGYFDEKYIVAADFEFWLRISQTNNFHHLSKPLGLYLDRANSVEHANKKIKCQEEMEIIKRYQHAADHKILIGKLSDVDKPLILDDPLTRISKPETEEMTQGGHYMNSPETILKAVAHLLNDGQRDAAYWTMGKLMADHPDNARLHSEMAVLAYEQGEVETALGHYTQAVALVPDNTFYLKNLGDFYYVVLKKAEDALAQYEKVLEKDPNCMDALILSGHVSTSLHCYAKAQQYYERVMQLDPDNHEIRALLEKMRLSVEGANASTMSSEDLYHSAQQKVSLGDPNAAISLLEQLVAMDDNHAVAHNDLGVLNYENGNIEKALEHYQKAATAMPENETFQKNLGDIYWAEMGDHHKALECYVQTLKLNPQDVEAQLSCGQICIALGLADDAADFFKNVLQIEPWNEDARQLLGRLEQRQGTLNVLSPAEETGAHPQTRSMENDPQGDILKLRQQLAASPNNAGGHNDLGVLYFEAGDKPLALKSYEQAVAIEPTNPTYCKNLADYYLIEQGRVEDAMKLYLRVLENDPMDVESLIATGLICVSIGKVDDAKHFYNRVLEIEPWNETAQKALNNLQTGMDTNGGDVIRTAASG